jgi:hypothetical protein
MTLKEIMKKYTKVQGFTRIYFKVDQQAFCLDYIAESTDDQLWMQKQLAKAIQRLIKEVQK